MPCNLVDVYWLLRGMCCTHHRGGWDSQVLWNIIHALQTTQGYVPDRIHSYLLSLGLLDHLRWDGHAAPEFGLKLLIFVVQHSRRRKTLNCTMAEAWNLVYLLCIAPCWWCVHIVYQSWWRMFSTQMAWPWLMWLAVAWPWLMWMAVPIVEGSNLHMFPHVMRDR